MKSNTRNNDYTCPFCGEPATIIKNTASYENHVQRKRVCMMCGKMHHTIEMRVDMMNVLNYVHSISKQMDMSQPPHKSS